MKSLLSILALLFAVSANADVFVTAQLRGLSYIVRPEPLRWPGAQLDVGAA
jgi:hypothetical protein